MIDQVTVRCSARALREALDKLEQVQGMLATALHQTEDVLPALAVVHTLHQIVVRTAQVEGTILVVHDWMGEGRSDDASPCGGG